MPYALIDWDNTVRKGATLFAWMAFLHDEKNAIEDKFITNRLKICECCRQGWITHDTLCGLCTQNYVASVKGMKESDYWEYVKGYLAWDKALDVQFNRVLFAFIKKYDMPMIIATGSPANLLHDFCGQMNVDKLFAFEEVIENGVLTGEAINDAGGAKPLAAAYALERFNGEKPLLAAGDSDSDIPMLDLATIKIVVGDNKELLERYPDCIHVHLDDESAIELSRRLELKEKELGLVPPTKE